MPEALHYFEHIERPVDAPPGVRVVQFLKIAYSKGAPELAIFRPLDKEMYVYKMGGWDYRPLAEFLERYRPINDEARILELDALCRELYPEG
jgi:hypothetical protein